MDKKTVWHFAAIVFCFVLGIIFYQIHSPFAAGVAFMLGYFSLEMYYWFFVFIKPDSK